MVQSLFSGFRKRNPSRGLNHPVLGHLCLGVFVFVSALFVPGKNTRADTGVFRDISWQTQVTDHHGKKEEITIHGIATGDPNGRQVILIHGTPGQADHFSHFMRDVADGVELIAYDRPGNGKSGPKHAIISLKEQGDALLPLLETRNGQKPIILGFSLGGPIAARVAIDHSDKIGGVIFLAAALDPAQEKPWWVQYVGQWWGIRDLLPRRLRVANDELMALKDELLALQPQLLQITHPIAIIHGTQDRLVPYENVPFMEAEMTSTRDMNMVILQDGNHFLPWNEAAKIRQAITDMHSKLEEIEHRAESDIRQDGYSFNAGQP